MIMVVTPCPHIERDSRPLNKCGAQRRGWRKSCYRLMMRDVKQNNTKIRSALWPVTMTWNLHVQFFNHSFALWCSSLKSTMTQYYCKDNMIELNLTVIHFMALYGLMKFICLSVLGRQAEHPHASAQETVGGGWRGVDTSQCLSQKAAKGTGRRHGVCWCHESWGQLAKEQTPVRAPRLWPRPLVY